MKYDVAIIGNGVLGRSVAFALSNADPSLSICVIGPEIMEGGASAAAGAMLNSFAEVTTDTFANEYGRAKFELGITATRLWPEWLTALHAAAEGAGGTVEPTAMIRDGTFVILNTRSGGLDDMNFDVMLGALDSYNERYELVDPSDIPGLQPVRDHRPLRAAYLPGEGSLDSAGLLQLLRAASSSVTYLNDVVSGVSVADGRVTAVTVSTGELEAGRFVFAAGAATQDLIDMVPGLGERMPPLYAGRGVAAVVEPEAGTALPSSVIRTPTRSGGCGLHAVPQHDGTVYIGASNEVSPRPRTKAGVGVAHAFLDAAMRQVNERYYDADIIGWRVGNRPLSLDGFPLIGATSLPNLWVLAGTYRDGFHCSPLLGRHIANLVAGDNGLIDHDLFLAERTLIQTTNREASISPGAKHFTSGSYEHGLHLPEFLVGADLEWMFQKRIEELYERLDFEFGLLPEFIDMLLASSDRDNAISNLQKQISTQLY